MAEKLTEEDEALLKELGVNTETKEPTRHTPEEERIIAGFEDIQRFVEEHGYAPQHGEDRDIFERLYAVRLDRIREWAGSRTLVDLMDKNGLLKGHRPNPAAVVDGLDDSALLAELGVEAATPPITELRHVRSTAEKRAAEEVANRKSCADFERFKPLFEQVQKELDAEMRETRRFERKAEIEQGRFFVVGGQKAFVAECGESFLTAQGMVDARLRVIFDNGTESSMLMRSLQRALNKDEAGRRITEPTAGPLFADQTTDGDEASGTIYVLRSKASLPIVEKHRDVLHKVGVTSGKVERRIANAKLDPTFLMAEVEIVATYELFNIHLTGLEKLIHRIFEPARLEIKVIDRFGNPITPREWFLVPHFAIDEAVKRIREGSISDYRYDPTQASLVARS